MPSPSSTAPYLDFLDETSPEEEERLRREREAAVSSPQAQSAQRASSLRNENFQDPYRAANLAATGRQSLLTSGQKQQTVAPGQWGLKSYTAQGRPENYSMDIPSNPFSDAAQIGGYLGTLGPVRDVAAQYGGPAAPLALLGPTAAAGYVSDVVSPGRSGAPTLRPEDQSPAYTGASGSDSAGSGTTDTSGSSAQRPGEYRSDVLNPDIRALLNAERQQGPSEAEALLLKATDRAAARSLGIAAGARGGAGARERAQRQAISANAAAGAQASADVAALRAQEDAARRQRQREIMGLLQGNAIAGDLRDLGYYESDQGLAGTKYNVNATNARFNAGQPPGFSDDPTAWLFEALTGRPWERRTV